MQVLPGYRVSLQVRIRANCTVEALTTVEAEPRKGSTTVGHLAAVVQAQCTVQCTVERGHTKRELDHSIRSPLLLWGKVFTLYPIYCVPQ